MKNELEQVFDNIAEAVTPEPQDDTHLETGLLHCGNCHTPKQCRVTLFGKENLMPCTCQCRQEQIEKEEQARKEQQRLNRIRRLKANCLQDRALFAYTFDKGDGDNPPLKYATAMSNIGQRLRHRGKVYSFEAVLAMGKHLPPPV